MIRGVCVMMCVLRTGDEGCDFKYIFSSFNRDQESVRKRIYFRPPTVPSYLQRTNVLITSAVYLCSSHFIRIPRAGALALFHRLQRISSIIFQWSRNDTRANSPSTAKLNSFPELDAPSYSAGYAVCAGDVTVNIRKGKVDLCQQEICIYLSQLSILIIKISKSTELLQCKHVSAMQPQHTIL